MVLTNQWSDVDDYLRGRPGKWRSQLRKIHAGVAEDPDVATDLVDQVDPDDAAWLAETVRRRHHPRSLARPPLSSLYFGQLCARPEFRFLTYRDQHARLLAFTAVLDTGSELVLTNWGSRSEVDGGRPNLYFDQYLRAIELMIASGRGRLVLGKGMTAIKARYGADPEPRWAVVGVR